MAYYKIKNLTHLLPKRHMNKNSVLDVQFVSGLEKRTHKLNTNSEIYISCTNLPISVHKLRMKKLVSVREVSQSEFFKAQNPKPKVAPAIEVKELKQGDDETMVGETIFEKVEPVAETPKKKRTYKKKSTEDSTVISTPSED